MELVDVVSAADAAVDRIGRVSVDQCDPTMLRNELRNVKRIQSKLDAQLARLTHAADCAGAFIGTGAKDTAEWLGKETGTSTRKNRTAAELGHAMANSDELAEAVTDGRLSSEQAAAAVGAAAGAALDAEVIDALVGLPFPAVRPAVEEWRSRHDPDGDAARADAQRARRYVHLVDQPDGMTRIDGLLDPESGAIVRTTLDGIMNESAFDGTNRTRDQRRADALTQLCAAASKGKLAGGRSNTKIIATVPFETITERGAARGVTHAGPTVDAETVRKMACDAGIHRMITGPGSSILDFGHENRLVSENQFLSLVARDQRCRWPGCTIRATWCDAHHIVHRAHDGPTRPGNLALFCHHHHQLSHQVGWKVTGTGDALEVHHPDGTVEISRPPDRAPPSASVHRPATTGRGSPDEAVLDPGSSSGSRFDAGSDCRGESGSGCGADSGAHSGSDAGSGSGCEPSGRSGTDSNVRATAEQLRLT